MRSVVLGGLWLLASTAASAGIVYDDVFFKDHYSRIVRERPVFANGTPLLSMEMSKSPNGFATATIAQTDPVKIPYNEETAHIEVTGDDIDPLYIEVKNFRGVSVSWATDRILIIKRDIGHVAAMEEVIDIVERRWLSRKALFYKPE